MGSLKLGSVTESLGGGTGSSTETITDQIAETVDDLVATVEREQVEAVLVSGDVYDRALPPPDAVRLLSRTLGRLRRAGAQVVLSAGNHDSPARLGFADEVLAAAGVHVRTTADSLTEPVRIDVVGSSADPAAMHLTVLVEENAQADVVIAHRGTAVLAQNVEFDVRRDARLNVVALQAWEGDAVHVSAQQASVATNAHFKHVAVSYGGGVVRLTPTARFAAERGEAEMYGLYFADAGQHLENRLFVDHNQPDCVSNVLYKGALQGTDARTVWVGDVLIRKEAEGTDTYEKNQNLLLSDGARADSVPNLEIETGVIEGAGHASATGRFDETQLFYLMARGIPETEARRLIVRGFLNEIIQKIGVGDVEDELTAVMEDELRIAQL
mgnify:CR=1 FL=1